VIGIIYKATSTNGKIYIGQTRKTLRKRKSNHKFQSLKEDRRTPFQTALLCEGFDSFQWEQIDTAETQAELDVKEKIWIEFYDSMNPAKGYNHQDGGKKCTLSAETLKKFSEVKIGERNNMFGRHHTPETLKKMSEALKGRASVMKGKKRFFSAEHRRKLSEAGKGNKNACKENREKV